MKFRVVTQDANLHMTQVEFTFCGVSNEVAIKRFIVAMERFGYKHTGFNKNPNHRAELQGTPKFDGLHGAMWDGGAVRYEDAQAYDTLSK